MCLPKQSPLSTIVYAYTLIAESTSVGETHKSFVPWGGGGLGDCWNVVGWGNVGMWWVGGMLECLPFVFERVGVSPRSRMVLVEMVSLDLLYVFSFCSSYIFESYPPRAVYVCVQVVP